jgi:hypothetical protein
MKDRQQLGWTKKQSEPVHLASRVLIQRCLLHMHALVLGGVVLWHKEALSGSHGSIVFSRHSIMVAATVAARAPAGSGVS